MATQAEKLAMFAEALKFEDIPSEVITRVKLHLLDILGIGLAASPGVCASRDRDGAGVGRRATEYRLTLWGPAARSECGADQWQLYARPGL